MVMFMTGFNAAAVAAWAAKVLPADAHLDADAKTAVDAAIPANSWDLGPGPAATLALYALVHGHAVEVRLQPVVFDLARRWVDDSTAGVRQSGPAASDDERIWMLSTKRHLVKEATVGFVAGQPAAAGLVV